MRWLLLSGLMLCNLIWATNPSMGKILLRSFDPLQVAWFRYASAWIAFMLVAPWLGTMGRFGRHGRGLASVIQLPRDWTEWSCALGMGALTFFAAPLLQATGLAASQATDNALIVAMEPLITVVLAALFLKNERILPIHAIAFGIALAGFCLLTGLSPGRLRQGLSPHLVGNLMMLVSLVGEGLYSVFAKKLMLRWKPGEVFGTGLTLGVAALTVALLAVGLSESGSRLLPGGLLQVVARLSRDQVFAILFIGPLGTTVTYLFWLFALSHAPVASIAVTLFIQPVFGALLGVYFLGEVLDGTQLAGGFLILSAVMIQTVLGITSRK